MEPNTKLYNVTLIDLGTYSADVVANSPEEATAIAKEQLWEAFQKPLGFIITKRETDADAAPAASQPRFVHSVTTHYKTKCALMVPSNTEAEAKEHFRRLLALNGPFEFLTGDDSFADLIVEQTSPNGESIHA